MCRLPERGILGSRALVCLHYHSFKQSLQRIYSCAFFPSGSTSVRAPKCDFVLILALYLLSIASQCALRSRNFAWKREKRTSACFEKVQWTFFISLLRCMSACLTQIWMLECNAWLHWHKSIIYPLFTSTQQMLYKSFCKLTKKIWTIFPYQSRQLGSGSGTGTKKTTRSIERTVSEWSWYYVVTRLSISANTARIRLDNLWYRAIVWSINLVYFIDTCTQYANTVFYRFLFRLLD